MVFIFVCVIGFMWVTCPGQGWIRRTSHDTGHSVAPPLRDVRTHIVQSGSHNHAAMLPWDGSHTLHTYSDLGRGRSLDRDKHKIKQNHKSHSLSIILKFLPSMLLSFPSSSLCDCVDFYRFQIKSTWRFLKMQFKSVLLRPGYIYIHRWLHPKWFWPVV